MLIEGRWVAMPQWNEYMEELRAQIVNMYAISPLEIGLQAYVPMSNGGWQQHRQYDAAQAANTEPLPEPEKHPAQYWLDQKLDCNNGMYSIEINKTLDTYHVYSGSGRLTICDDIGKLREYMHKTRYDSLRERIDSNDAYTYVNMDSDTWVEGVK
jgi:hypothetical protein